MRTLYVHSGNLIGGVERVLNVIASEPHRCEPRFALCFEGPFADGLRARRAQVDILGAVRMTRPDLVLRARRRLLHLIRQEQPDVVITQSTWAHALFAPVVRRARLPLAVWIHDVLSGKPWLERLAARWQPDLLLCDSVYTQAAARTVFRSAPCEVVYYPLTFDACSATRKDIRRRYAVPDDAVVIVNVARMEPYKGQDVLLEALARLKASGSHAFGWLVGGAQRSHEIDYRDSLARSIERHGLQDRVRMVGQQDDAMSILGAADIYCHPNTGPEPFGIAIVEALHAGLPVVATQLGGPPEIVTAECGYLVPPRDAGALANALTPLIADSTLRVRLGRAGPRRAAELCDPTARLEQLSQALNGLAFRMAA